MKSRGFTVVEIVIVCLLTGILIGIAVPSFRNYRDKESIKRQVKELQSNIASIRLSAMQSKKRSIMYLGANQYTYRTYSSNNDPVGILSTPYTYSLVLKRTNGATLADLTSNATTDCIEFDTSGFTVSTTCTNSNMTLVVTPVTYNSGDNCIAVGTARTNIGRMENVSTCRKW